MKQFVLDRAFPACLPSSCKCYETQFPPEEKETIPKQLDEVLGRAYLFASVVRCGERR